MSENPGSNKIRGNKGSCSIEVYFPILFYKYVGNLIGGRFMEDGRLMRVSMGWWDLRLSVSFFQLRLTKKLKINFFCFKKLNIN